MLASVLGTVLAVGSVAHAAPASPAALPTCSGNDACVDVSIAYSQRVVAGASFDYTITATNHGPAGASNAILGLAVEGARFESLTPAPGWSCFTGAEGADFFYRFCMTDSNVMPVGSSAFTLTARVDPASSGDSAVFMSATLDADNSPDDSESVISGVASDAAFSNGFESP